MRRRAGALLAPLLVGVVTLAVLMRWVADEPAGWHVDPMTAARTGKPNDYLVAPDGATKARPDRIAEVHDLSRGELLRRFDAVAMAAPRTKRAAGSADEGWVTFVQRSRFFGFPDYITVKAVEAPGGSALIVWSRSRFGYSDFGVNRARVESWLAELAG